MFEIVPSRNPLLYLLSMLINTISDEVVMSFLRESAQGEVDIYFLYYFIEVFFSKIIIMNKI